ncbi:MAG: hypothetical protein NTY19_52095 [Planctomycetota bacterium]|nr:hypothetical protein [Planctomycetota bacterium]
MTKKTDPQPAKFDGKILVPFCIESALSGVNRKFTPEDRLWYSRDFTAPALAQGEHLLLNFGAVDYEATVLVNGKELGTHRGGYDAFSWDITEALQPGANRLVVAVLDPTGGGPSGKQRLGGGDIWYTPSSGIWQTVWLEKVPENGLMTYDRKVVKANVDLFREALSKREFPPEPTVKALLPSLSSTPSSPTPFPGKGACLSQ